MKKKILYIPLSVIMLLIVGACTDNLDLAPHDAIDKEDAISTGENVMNILTGAYDVMSSGNVFGGNTLRNSELLAANDEIAFSGTFNDPLDIFNKEMTTTNADVTAMWNSCYNAINTVNNVLQYIDLVDAADRDQVRGEALYLRGLLYFELVKFFAQPYTSGNPAANMGVPITTTPTMTVNEGNITTYNIPRSSVQAVYDLILSDLTTAEPLLSSSYSPARASQEAAAALLSRVYLQMEDFDAARDAADRVIASETFELAGSVEDAFVAGTSDEDIFELPVSEQDGANNMNVFYAATVFGGRGDIEVQSSHFDIYEDGDERAELFYADPATDDIRTSKWEHQFGNVNIIRLSEMYLTRAEANFRLGTAVGDTPLNDVNAIRDRAGLSPLAVLTLDDIIHERRVELAHEGERLHDVKRLRLSIDNNGSPMAFDDDFLVFPIPQREINANPALTNQQNPGYE